MAARPQPEFKPPSPVGPEIRPEWSSRLVMDVALNSSKESILETYDLQDHQYEQICASPVFVGQVEALRKELEKDGASFRLKNKLLADEFLKHVYEMVTDKSTDSRVRTRLIESTVRWAGFDAPVAGAEGGIGGFNITINLGSSKQDRGIIIDGNQP